MKHEKTSQLGFGDLQMQRRKVKSGFFNQINAVIDWHPLRALIEPPYAKGFSLTGHPCYDCMVLFRMEQYEEAENYINQALRASEQETARGVIFEHQGDILMKLGRKSEALAAYREALDYSEDDDFDPERVKEKIRQLE